MHAFKLVSILSFVVVGLSSLKTNAQTQKRLYIANDDHTDYMWSADEAKYDSAFVKMIDYYLDKADETKNNPDNFQSRFNCDGNYWVNTYQKYRSPAQFNRLIEAIRSGHISSPLNSVVSTFGAQPAEAAIRGMYYAGHLERKYNLRFALATAMENNTVPLGLSSIWAGSGAKYSWKGIGGYGSQIPYEVRKNRRYQLYRYSGLDSSSVLMKWYNYNEEKTIPLGGYGECRLIMKTVDVTKEIGAVINKLDAFCDTITAGSKYPYNVGGAFGYGHDDLDTYVADAFVKAAMDGTNATRSVRVSNEEDFFKDVERSYPKLPSESISFGNEWDLLCASMNETTAEVKRATEKLRSAEALASIVSLQEPEFANHLAPARKLAWDALGLYWEHNWTGDGPVTNKARGDWQIKIKNQLSGYVESLYNLSLRKLSSNLKAGINPRFVVFNPLSWTRNDVADVAYLGAYPVKVIDVTSNKEVLSQLITKNGKRFLRIAALNVPSVGYKIFEIRKGTPTAPAKVVTAKGEYLSNSKYRLRLSPSGVITEIVDKSNRNKQLVKVIDGKYFNDLGSSNVNDGKPVTIENAGPVSVTLKAVSTNPVKHTVRVTLFANSPRIDIENSIDENFADVKTWAFSLNVDKATTKHEELGAILTVKKESKGGHYSDIIARYDWQTFNHFLNVGNKDFGITLSNQDCSFFKLGQSTKDSLWDTSSQISALAGGQVDRKWEDKGLLGIHKQNGLTQFNYHFALTANQAPFNAVNSMKFSLEHQNPLVAASITGGKATTASTSFSLLKVSNPEVLLWSVKPAEEGIREGLITRFWNFNTTSAKPVVKFHKPISSAWQTSHIETNQEAVKPIEGALKATLKPQQLKTYRITLPVNN